VPATAKSAMLRGRAPTVGPPGVALRVAQRLYQPAYLLPLAVAIAGIVLWPYVTAWTPKFETTGEYALAADQLELTPGHTAVPADLSARILERVSQHLGGSPLLVTERLAERIADAAAREPWVARVNRVEVHRAGTVSVDLTYREPAAMVSTPQGLVPVDGTGVVLPRGDVPLSSAVNWPVIADLGESPRGPAGEVWGSLRVEGAARLALLLLKPDGKTSAWQRLGLREIDVLDRDASGGDSSPVYELITLGGSRIVWGDAPGTDSLEPPADIKLARLDYYLQQCGSFESGTTPCRIDIRDIAAIQASVLEVTRR
jgi:hypothetical protein